MSKFLLPFAEGLAGRRRFSPAAMVVATLAAAVVISIQSSPVAVGLLILFLLIGGTCVRTRWRTVLSLALRFEIVILFWVLLEPILYGSTVLFTIQTPLGPVNFYAEGLDMGMLLGLRMLALLLLFLTVLSHMTLGEFIDALRTLRVPTVLVSSLLVMLRYIPLFLEEKSRLQEAQLLRGFHRGTRWERIRTLGYAVGSTIDRALNRSVSVYEAMALRGLGTGSAAVGSGFRRPDAVLLLVPILMVVAIQWFFPLVLEVFRSWSLLLL